MFLSSEALLLLSVKVKVKIKDSDIKKTPRHFAKLYKFHFGAWCPVSVRNIIGPIL